MARQWLAGALALSLAAIGGPAAAADVLYRHAAGAPQPLRVYDGKPYWTLLADCTGMVMAMGEFDGRRGQARDAQSAKEIAAHLLMRSVNRYAADRRVPTQAAQGVVTRQLTGARQSARRELAGPRAQHFYENMGLMCQAAAADYDRRVR
jgi:hypothetical protein